MVNWLGAWVVLSQGVGWEGFHIHNNNTCPSLSLDGGRVSERARAEAAADVTDNMTEAHPQWKAVVSGAGGLADWIPE